LATLINAERTIRLDGDALVHMDVRSDNLCFHGERTLLVDWNWARRGNPAFDRIAWLPSLHMEGGPPPWSLTLGEPEIIAAIAGYFASRAFLSPPEHPAGPAIRTLQRRQLESALPWAARALGLPTP
jgi:Ser/Thr protein kinase RdoA (MazF antagonist)